MIHETPRQPTELFPFCRGGRWGFIDRGGQVVVAPRYDDARPGTEGLAAVAFKVPRSLWQRLTGRETHRAWGYIDACGELQIEPTFLDVAPFSEGLASAASPENGRWGFIDRAGAWVIRARYGGAGAYAEGLAPVYVERTGMWGYMNREEHFDILPKFNHARAFSRGMAAVSSEPLTTGTRGTWGVIGPSGEWIIRPQFDEILDFSQEGLAPAMPGPRDEVFGGRRGRWGYVTRSGEWAIEPQFLHASSFADGFALVAVRDGEGPIGYRFIRPDSATAFEVKDYAPQPFSGGLAALADPDAPNRVRGYIDPSGSLLPVCQ